MNALPGPDDIAAVGLALGDLDIRDYALRRINSGTFEGNRVDLWIWVARHLEDDLVAPAATVAGFAAYRFGNGVLALEAFELALRSTPHYRLAQMLMAALQAGIPPAALSRIGCGDREEAEVERITPPKTVHSTTFPRALPRPNAPNRTNPKQEKAVHGPTGSA